MKGAIAIALVGLLTLTAGEISHAQVGGASASTGGTCAKSDFERVVETAASSLRDLNARNAPGFQDKLRLLRERRKWTAEEFMDRAAPFVQDDRIAGYDQRSNDLLNKINSMGEAGTSSAAPDCKLLEDLRGTMKSLIDTQIEKWAYMFAKIERGLVN